MRWHDGERAVGLAFEGFAAYIGGKEIFDVGGIRAIERTDYPVGGLAAEASLTGIRRL